MPTQSQILAALQMYYSYNFNAMNTTGSSRRVITYQFDNNQTNDIKNASGGTVFPQWHHWTKAERHAVNAMLHQYETFLNVDFQQVHGQSDPDLNLGRVQLDSLYGNGTAGYGGNQILYSGANITRWDGFAAFDNDYSITNHAGAQVIAHEIGHALMLKHPFQGTYQLDNAHDNSHFTMMSYTSDPHSGTANNAPMLYDILALQDIWGAAAYHTGNNTYKGRGPFDVRVIWDTGGTDTISAKGKGHDTMIDLRAGHFSTLGSYQDVAVAFGVKIERAIGSSHNDRIIGNGLGNVIKAGGGADTLIGKAGMDNMHGQGGRDTLKGGGGNDRLFGDGGNDHVFGNAGNDLLAGNRGNDTLKGAGGADTFLYKSGFDHDQVLDFAHGVDTLKVVGMGSSGNVLSHASQSGADVYFDFGGGDTLLVKNIALADLQSDLVVA